MPDVPITLIEQIEAGRCVLFVGPEASLPDADRSGPPGAARLAAELALRVGRQLDDYSLPWIAQLYEDKWGRYALHDYVSQRLDAPHYRPTELQHLIARLPIQWVVCTAQDRLLRQAFQDQGVQVTHVLTGDALSYGAGRVLIQPYGIATQPATLLLTEDQQRQALAEQSGLAQFLRLQASTNSVVFLGYALSDPTFRDLYRALRPQTQDHTPRAYAVAEAEPLEEGGYWQQQNLSVVYGSGLDFLTQVAATLTGRGKARVLPPQPCEPPPPISAAEREERSQVFLRLSQELGIASPVESGVQLRPAVNRLAFMRRVLAELPDPQAPATPERATRSAQIPPDAPAENLTAQILLQQGYAEWAEGNHERGREFFESAIARAPDLIDAYFSLFYLLVEEEQFAEAAGVYRQILARAPEQAVLPERFQIQAVLGQSSAGIAYRAYDTELRQVVTVTTLRRALAGDPERLEQVGAQLAGLNGKGISRLLGLARHRGRAYLVTEYVEGETLRSRLRSGGPFALQPALQVFNGVAVALANGHSQGVAHLSLTPDNIILSPGGPVLLGYGIAGLGKVAGGPGDEAEYASPEQRAGQPGDKLSDIYALGTIFYEMLTGHHPGVGAYLTVSEARPDADEAIDVLIARARAFDPARRYATVEDMRQEALRVFGRGAGSLPTRTFRRGLVGLSDGFGWLASARGGAVLAGVFVLYVVGFELWDGLAGLRVGVRLALLLLAGSTVASIVSYYVVRETARVHGLGSLARTGRGIGAVFGALIAFWWFRVTEWTAAYPSLAAFDVVDLLGYGAVVVMVAVILTVLFIAIMGAAAGRAEVWWHKYRTAFYGVFLILCGLLVVLAVVQQPFGIIKY